MENILMWIINICTVFITCYISYYFLISLAGFLKGKKRYKIIEDKSKFCIFVPCHNEENVIGATIMNLSKIDYNSKLFDIFIIADNCNDNTVKTAKKIIKDNGFSYIKVLKRIENDPSKKGKPHALRWGIELLEQKDKFYNKYDMFMILDADNFADSNILKEFNSQYHSFSDKRKPSMIQCYLDSKNSSNIISKGYSTAYRVVNRFFQLSKSRLGINCAIGGTGFAITTKFLNSIGGFNAKSLTEDLEIQTIATLQNKYIAYNHNVRIYDEKPTGIKQSYIQKTRWSQGHWWVAFNNVFKLIFGIFRSKNIRNVFSKIDNLIYLFFMLNYTLVFVTLISYISCYAMGYKIMFFNSVMSKIILFYMAYQFLLLIPVSSMRDGTKKEKRRMLIELPINFIALSISSFIFCFASITALFKVRNQKVWAKTTHRVSSIDTARLKVVEGKKKIKVLTVFGTRPEAIKMAPLVKKLAEEDQITSTVCVTAQHRKMLDQVLKAFKIKPNYDLNIMKKKQSLTQVTNRALKGLQKVIKKSKPDMLLVHGDTTTAFAGSLAAFYNQIKIGHIEAGLRTWNIASPYPEEANRVMVGALADLHFTPTQSSKSNLLKECKNENNIFITGNTAIDALKTTVKKEYNHKLFKWVQNSKLIMLTAHRRENLGDSMRNMFRAILRIVKEFKDVKVIYPIHLNPKVRRIAKEIFKGNERIKLIEPLEVIDFHNFLAKSYMILTDSGGIQEEAPSLGKPVLVLRDTTERPEGVEAGTLRLVGTNEQVIYENIKELLTNKEVYDSMAKANNPYGDGTASEQIINNILKHFSKL